MMLQQAQSTGTKILNYASLNFENKRPPTHPVGFRSQPASAVVSLGFVGAVHVTCTWRCWRVLRSVFGNALKLACTY